MSALIAKLLSPESRVERLWGAFLIATLAVLGYWLRFPLIFGVYIQLGSIPILLAIMLWRGWTGFWIGCLASITTWSLWGHPWGALTISGELLWLTVMLNYVYPSPAKTLRGDIVIWDMVFWLFLGIPLIIGIYTKGFTLEPSDAMAAAVDLCLNGIINISIAFAIFLLARLLFASKEGHLVTLRGAIVAIMQIAIAVPLLLLIIVSSTQLERAVETGELDSLKIYADKIARSSVLNLKPQEENPTIFIDLREFRITSPNGEQSSSDPALFERIDKSYVQGNWSGMPDNLDILIEKKGAPAIPSWLRGYWQYQYFFSKNGQQASAYDSGSSLIEVINPAREKILQLEAQIVRLFSVFIALMVVGFFISQWIGIFVAQEFRKVLEPLNNSSYDSEVHDSRYREIPTLRISAISELHDLVERVNDQIKKLNHANRSMSHANHELSISHDELSRISLTDPLTNCLNRRSLKKRLAEAIEDCKSRKAPLALISFDIDHFKSINDEHGHQVGDIVIVDVVNQVRSRLRASDSLFRVGGDEFLVILPSCSERDAVIISTELCKRVNGSRIDAMQTLPLQASISVGVGVFDGECDGPQSLLEKLDKALYEAKYRGRNQVAFCK